MRKCGRKSNVEIINEEVKGSSSELEDIKICKCSRKSHVDIINEVMKGSSIEEKDILISKFRRRSRVDIINEEVKRWTSSSKQQEAPQKPKKIKEDICLEQRLE